MPLLFSCSSGHYMTVDPACAGLRVRCPVCQEILVAPNPVEQAAAVAILVGPPPAPVPEGSQPSAAIGAGPPPILVPTNPEYSINSSPPMPNLEIPPSAEEPPPYALAPEEKVSALVEEVVPPEDERPAKRPKRTKESSGEDDDHGRALKAERKLRQQLDMISQGLNLHYWKYLCFVFSIFLTLTGAILTALVSLMGILGISLAFAAGIAAPILGIIGSNYCNGPIIPPETRSLILTSQKLDIAALAVSVLGALTLIFFPLAGLVLLTVLGLLNQAAFTLFMVFLKKLALYLNDAPAAQRCHDGMIAFLAVALGGFGVIVFLATIVWLFIPIAAPLIFLALDIVWIVLVIQTLFRVLHVIAEVRERMAKQ